MIHRFHRDVAEALSRIHDKDAALSDDLGKDSNSVLALIRKHEGFENDLVALEAQLQVNSTIDLHVIFQNRVPCSRIGLLWFKVRKKNGVFG